MGLWLGGKQLISTIHAAVILWPVPGFPGPATVR